jgi:hypothetical protein
MTRIYWTSIEYNYNIEQSSNEGLVGGFVYAFVSSTDNNEARSKFLSALKEQQMTAREVDFITPYPDDTEWKNEEQTKHYKTLFEVAKKTEDVIFDTFYAYEKP